MVHMYLSLVVKVIVGVTPKPCTKATFLLFVRLHLIKQEDQTTESKDRGETDNKTQTKTFKHHIIMPNKYYQQTRSHEALALGERLAIPSSYSDGLMFYLFSLLGGRMHVRFFC